MAGKSPAAGGSAEEFWPYRNQMLVTLAAMFLMPQGVKEIMVGSVSTDRHADGRAPFYRALDRTISLQEGHLHVTAPARKYSTPKLLKISGFPYDLIGLTFSCHVYEYACGQCNGLHQTPPLRRRRLWRTTRQNLMAGFPSNQVRRSRWGAEPSRMVGDGCDLRFTTDLVGVRSDISSRLEFGDQLSVRINRFGEIRSAVCVTAEGEVVGTLAAFVGLARLLTCMENHAIYFARVQVASATRCSVEVSRQ